MRFSAEDFKVSTYHKAVGGYHPAKLRIYQDVIERYFLSGVDPQQVLNMLNVKYVIFENPQNGQQSLMVNDQAYGPCWLVKGIRQVNSDADELQAIGVTNLRDTAVIQKAVAQPQWDSTASLTLAKHDNDAIEYNFQASSPQFAVFSEIYYPYGWNAYIDGNKVEHSRVNYILRGMSIPAGKHSIRFVFEPATYKKGASLSFIGSILVALLILGGLFMHWRESRREKELIKK